MIAPIPAASPAARADAGSGSSAPVAGINLIGYATANFSLGNTLRHVASALRARGVPISVLDLPQARQAQGRDESLRAHQVAAPEALPYDVNLFCLPVSGIVDLLLHPDAFRFRWQDRLNIALIFWELPRMPAHWSAALSAFDAVLCSSWFIRETVAAHVPNALAIYMPYPLVLPPVIPVARSAHGIPDDAFVFYFSFDPFSGIERKNPAAILEAFNRAFAGARGYHLAIKMNVPPARAAAQPAAARRFAAACGKAPNVTLISASMPYGEALGLAQACDCFVSLHRSEGLGMAPMEAMLMGKPVIMTAWSGAMSYADATSVCLVPADLADLGRGRIEFKSSFMRGGAFWAEPSVSAAAYWMKKLAFDVDFRERVAASGRERMTRYLREAAACRFVEEIAQLPPMKAAGALLAPDLAATRRRILRAVRFNPRWRMHRVRAFFNQRLLWRFARVGAD